MPTADHASDRPVHPALAELFDGATAPRSCAMCHAVDVPLLEVWHVSSSTKVTVKALMCAACVRAGEEAVEARRAARRDAFFGRSLFDEVWGKDAPRESRLPSTPQALPAGGITALVPYRTEEKNTV